MTLGQSADNDSTQPIAVRWEISRIAGDVEATYASSSLPETVSNLANPDATVAFANVGLRDLEESVQFES